MTRLNDFSHLADPGSTLAAIDALCPLRIGTTVVAAVRLEDQEVVAARVLHTGESTPDPFEDDGSELVREAAHALLPERDFVPATKRWAPITHTFVTVVCRDGRVIDTAREWNWTWCWRYANHFRPAFDGDVFVVTPYGWTGSCDERAGFTPTTRPFLALAVPGCA